jgi:hypothetical protein
MPPPTSMNSVFIFTWQSMSMNRLNPSMSSRGGK